MNLGLPAVLRRPNVAICVGAHVGTRIFNRCGVPGVCGQVAVIVTLLRRSNDLTRLMRQGGKILIRALRGGWLQDSMVKRRI